MTGQKYEKYDAEVNQIGNETLVDDFELFDDRIDTLGMQPRLSDYPLKTEEELMDTSGARW